MVYKRYKIKGVRSDNMLYTTKVCVCADRQKRFYCKWPYRVALRTWPPWLLCLLPEEGLLARGRVRSLPKTKLSTRNHPQTQNSLLTSTSNLLQNAGEGKAGFRSQPEKHNTRNACLPHDLHTYLACHSASRHTKT